jgi:hypothetical protein
MFTLYLLMIDLTVAGMLPPQSASHSIDTQTIEEIVQRLARFEKRVKGLENTGRIVTNSLQRVAHLADIGFRNSSHSVEELRRGAITDVGNVIRFMNNYVNRTDKRIAELEMGRNRTVDALYVLILLGLVGFLWGSLYAELCAWAKG